MNKYIFSRYQRQPEALKPAVILSDFVGLLVLLAILIWVVGRFYRPIA